MQKIKILFQNFDGAGVNFFRTQSPAIKLNANHSDKFFIDINPHVDLSQEHYNETIEYLKGYNIIHYHRTLHQDLSVMKRVSDELRKNGTILVADIDDYWDLDKSHPMYSTSQSNKLGFQIIESLKMADYISTTTEVYANEIRKTIRGSKVVVFPNAIDPENMEQFKDKKFPDPNGLVRIAYSAGSSHKGDISLLTGVVNILNGDVIIGPYCEWPKQEPRRFIVLSGGRRQGKTYAQKLVQNLYDKFK